MVVADDGGFDATVVRSGFTDEGLRLSLVVFTPVRLGGCVVFPVPNFATDAVVGAVIEPGRRTGRVGDLARVLARSGEDCEDAFLEGSVEVPRGFGAIDLVVPALGAVLVGLVVVLVVFD